MSVVERMMNLNTRKKGDGARTARASVGGMWYHALNRGNRRAAVFPKPADIDAFVEAIADAGKWAGNSLRPPSSHMAD